MYSTARCCLRGDAALERNEEAEEITHQTEKRGDRQNDCHDAKVISPPATPTSELYKRMQATAAISEVSSFAPCKDGSEDGSLGLMQPLYMTVKPILPSVFFASHFFFFHMSSFCQQRLLICRIKCNSCWIVFQQEMEFLVVVVQFYFSSKSDCFPDKISTFH